MLFICSDSAIYAASHSTNPRYWSRGLAVDDELERRWRLASSKDMDNNPVIGSASDDYNVAFPVLCLASQDQHSDGHVEQRRIAFMQDSQVLTHTKTYIVKKQQQQLPQIYSPALAIHRRPSRLH